MTSLTPLFFPSRYLIRRGTSSSAVSEWPSLPYPPKPQLNALLFSSTATVWLGPHEILLMTGTGICVTSLTLVSFSTQTITCLGLCSHLNSTWKKTRTKLLPERSREGLHMTSIEYLVGFGHEL